MAKLYRIYTEDVNREEIERLAALQFDSFSISNAVGYWTGSRECSLVVEVFEPVAFYHAQQKVGKLAQAIKQANKQEAVLVIELDCEGVLI
jgi:hypothetical protein